MLLSKTVIAALIATAAGGIIIGSATTYVVVNNNDCVIPPVVEESSKKKDIGVPEISQMYCARALFWEDQQVLCDREKKNLKEKYGEDVDVTPTQKQIDIARREYERATRGLRKPQK